jgi:hypothetical protein
MYNSNLVTIHTKIIEGTTYISDKWAAYGGLDEHSQGSHFTVNHSKYYVDPRYPQLHSNTIERQWRTLKRKSLKSRKASTLESHLLTHCYRENKLKIPFQPDKPKARRMITNAGDSLDIILNSIIKVYPGYPRIATNGIVTPEPLTYPPRVDLPVSAYPYGKFVSVCMLKSSIYP